MSDKKLFSGSALDVIFLIPFVGELFDVITNIVGSTMKKENRPSTVLKQLADLETKTNKWLEEVQYAVSHNNSRLLQSLTASTPLQTVQALASASIKNNNQALKALSMAFDDFNSKAAKLKQEVESTNSRQQWLKTGFLTPVVVKQKNRKKAQQARVIRKVLDDKITEIEKQYNKTQDIINDVSKRQDVIAANMVADDDYIIKDNRNYVKQGKDN